ncbi:RDD family protein [Sulfidibacter corallicola]|uniref:RDD family protein n=1 Tax=Sulfidibacter corallicola TaxID=2818388 RepID=A0A8A4TT22_SULCO|nr:RDD family protein [Sulfidibacter corallicola]QTD53106.1 RDD family protein [Sulfidibacter corallicola]
MSNSVLRRKKNDGTYEEFTLSKPITTIGRSRSNDIVINDTSVSRLHVRVENRNGQYFVLDNNSSNGTFLNKKKITEAPIRSGDTLVTGRIYFYFTEQTEQMDPSDSATATLPTLDANANPAMVKSTRPMQAVLPPDHDRTLRSSDESDPFWTPPPAPMGRTAATPPPAPAAAAATQSGGEELLAWDDSALEDLDKYQTPKAPLPTQPGGVEPMPPSPPPQAGPPQAGPPPAAPPQTGAPKGRFPLPMPGEDPPPPPAPATATPPPAPGGQPAQPQGRFPLPVPQPGDATPPPAPHGGQGPVAPPQPDPTPGGSIFDNVASKPAGAHRNAEPVPRLVAFLIDWAVGFALILPAFIFVIAKIGWLAMAFYLLGMIANLAHFVFGWAKFGKTVGKHIMKLRIIEEKSPAQEGLSPKAVLLRLLVPGFTFGIAYIFIFIDPERRGLHDKIADTRVIQE